MVAHDAEAVGCGQISDIGLTVAREVHRSRQGRFQQAGIAQTGPAAMLGDLLVMHGEDDRGVDPDPAHARSALISQVRAARPGALS